MSATGHRRAVRGAWARGARVGALALVVIAFGAFATAAAARKPQPQVNIVRQAGPPAGEIPKNTHYFTTIQAAVTASTKGDYVLIEPGVYDEEVKVASAQSGIYIRGMDRNKVIVDGQHKVANGIEIKKANDVWVENLTVRNFEFGEGCVVEECGNDIWWNGGAGSGAIGAQGWYGSYLTAYDTGLHGGYGEFTGNEQHGSFENIYASGFADSGFYIGACRDCFATVNKAVMEDNALGYSGSNSSGHMVIENSVFKHNLIGIAPNSENPGDPPPPLDGACNAGKNTSPTPRFKSTAIKHCEILRGNVVEENSNVSVPTNGSTEIAIWGAGIELPGDYGVLVENNTIKNNPNDGVLGFEYPNPFTPPAYEKTLFFQFAGNRIVGNTFEHNGYNLPSSLFAGDLAMLSGYAGLFGTAPESESENDCVSGNAFADTVWPLNVEGTWGCANKHTPNPNGGSFAAEYLLERQGEIKAIKESDTVAQPAPPEQPTMPNPCQGVPVNPLCP
jgi:hypothetical protein